MSKDGKLRVISPAVGQDACSFYRVRQLLSGLRKRDNVETHVISKNQRPDTIDQLINQADIILFRPNHHQVQAKLLYDRASGKLPRTKFVFDHDDNVHEISPYSSHYKDYGTSDFYDEGTANWIWQDGKKGFYIYDNMQRIAQIDWQAQAADLMTGTTELLLDAYKHKRGYVIPNAIDFDLYPDVGVVRSQNKDEIRIGWQGGESHYEDLLEVAPEIVRLMKKYPKVKLVIQGAFFGGLFKEIDDDRIERYGWLPTKGFTYRSMLLDTDIELAPLMDTKFNAFKSSIKFYHAAALKRPMLAKRINPHTEDIIDGETGYMYYEPDEFGEKLEELILSEEKRKELGQSAYDWVRENRDINDIAEDVETVFRELTNVG